MKALKRAASAAIERRKKALFALSDRLHKNPELGMREHRAAEWITELLEAEGFSVERGICGLPTAFRGTRRGRGPNVVFMAEYDALPIGHACGHNLIAAAAVGAGIGACAALSKLRKGRIEVLGTPGEEGYGGKIILVKKGALRGRDAALMMHPASRTYVHLDKLEVEHVRFRYYGKAAHAAASPHLGVNALDAAINTFVNVNALRQHIRPDARVHGIISKGGDKPNIIPEFTEAEFYVRALDGPYLDDLIRRVHDCARGAAKAAGARVRFERLGLRYKSALRNGPIHAAFRANLAAAGEKIEEPPATGGIGSSDFGNVSHALPALHGYISAGRPGMALHTAAFRESVGGPKGRRAILLGAKALAHTAIDLLGSPRLLAEAKADFKRRKKELGKGY